MRPEATMEQVLRAVRDVDYPAGRDDLLRAAQEADASGEVLRVLQALPPEEYANKEEVSHSVRLSPDTGLTAAQRAEQARLGGRPGQAQHLREVPRTPVEEELDR